MYFTSQWRGVFVVLLCGLALAILVAILEFCWNSKKNAQTDRQSLCSEMAEELRFAVRCHGSRQRPALRRSCTRCSPATTYVPAALDLPHINGRRLNAGGTSTFTCTSSAIRDCCGGPSNSRPQKAATLNYRATPQCPDLAKKSATLGRNSGFCRDACDVVQSGLHQDVPDKILWKFDCDIGSPNNPDVVTRTLPDAIPAQSPDLNPIEHLWDHMERQVAASQPAPINLNDLGNKLVEIWDGVDQDYIRHLTSSRAINSFRLNSHQHNVNILIMLLISSRIDLDAVFVLVKDHDERTTTVFKLPARTNERIEDQNSYLYIKATKSFFNVSREKLSPRPLATEQDNLEDIKSNGREMEFRGRCFRYAKYSFRKELKNGKMPSEEGNKSKEMDKKMKIMIREIREVTAGVREENKVLRKELAAVREEKVELRKELAAVRVDMRGREEKWQAEEAD
ncbi:hypothetical protein GEV33_013756 [Tenebrio molitor]|uniref:Uncharacterized protein n=1 Tax=Tenebrio molitor TaxID=7067 RepID=A0A8J6H6Z4_TENMO|nr:hypothetical protein GEV33_013756 [Tenebrio molitor]